MFFGEIWFGRISPDGVNWVYFLSRRAFVVGGNLFPDGRLGGVKLVYWSIWAHVVFLGQLVWVEFPDGVKLGRWSIYAKGVCWGNIAGRIFSMG